MTKKSKVEYLLICLMEECAEIQKEASKILRFGPKDKYMGSTPVERLKIEINDLKVVIMELSRLAKFDLRDNVVLHLSKLNNLKKYMKHSRKRGMLK